MNKHLLPKDQYHVSESGARNSLERSDEGWDTNTFEAFHPCQTTTMAALSSVIRSSFQKPDCLHTYHACGLREALMRFGEVNPIGDQEGLRIPEELVAGTVVLCTGDARPVQHRAPTRPAGEADLGVGVQQQGVLEVEALHTHHPLAQAPVLWGGEPYSIQEVMRRRHHDEAVDDELVHVGGHLLRDLLLDEAEEHGARNDLVLALAVGDRFRKTEPQPALLLLDEGVDFQVAELFVLGQVDGDGGLAGAGRSCVGRISVSQFEPEPEPEPQVKFPQNLPVTTNTTALDRSAGGGSSVGL